MKIAIQGHLTRGEEVISILESLGGSKNCWHIAGTQELFYFINEKNEIRAACKDRLPSTYKFYTLEEFEKLFPFKIGDKVIYDYDPYIGTVVDIKFDDNIPYRVNINGTICTCETKLLNYYKPMDTRNITLTLDKAKEWYNKGGELKEIALQAYTKEELNPLPKSWEEYCKGYKVPVMIFGPCIPNKYVALWKLEQLRDCYRQGWKPKWNSSTSIPAIHYTNEGFSVYALYTRTFLSFQSRRVAEEFLKNFEPLMKEAGDLI